MKKFSSDESYVYVNVVLLLIILALVVYCCIKNREKFDGVCVIPQNHKSDGSCRDVYGDETDWGSMIPHGLDDDEFKIGSQKISPEQACTLCLDNAPAHLSDAKKKERCVNAGMCKE
jgi:hypothetical protein